MSDNLTPEDRRRTMQAVKSKKTAPERRLRAFLAGSGYHGWRLNCKDIQGNPDVAFPEQKIAIFVDGCFWHGCPVCNRPLPRANHDYWEAKIRRNIERDKAHIQLLEQNHWRVIRLWEHQLKKNVWSESAAFLKQELHRYLTAEK